MTTAQPQLNLYNTLTRSKAPFVPMDKNNVRLYACGPTVYDFAHIGNGRAAIVFDLLFRVLRHVYGPDHVTYVRNITDVDDKINARALRDHPDLSLNEAIRKVTETTAAQYQKDVAALGCLEPTIQPRATENIAEMQAMIQRLLTNGHAYEAGGEVLFSVESMADYGQLSGRNLEGNLAGARIAVDAHKRNAADFVLWKQSSAEEPGWDSPWGRGRPGWHIECSAMSERYLGETFDIHGGGLDLIFPHHENEIAQSRCAHGSHAMANVWMHNGFLQVEGQKMSKSLGNFITIFEALQNDLGDTIRWLMLKTHYRQPVDFTVHGLELASRELEKFSKIVSVLPRRYAQESFELDRDFEARILDDLDTPGAIARLHELAASVELSDWVALRNALMFMGIRYFDEPATYRKSAGYWGEVPDGLLWSALRWRASSLNGLTEVSERLQREAGAMGWRYVTTNGATQIEAINNTESLDEKVAMAISLRLAALNAKDFAEADRIRNELAEQGIALMDYKDEAGQRATKWEVKR